MAATVGATCRRGLTLSPKEAARQVAHNYSLLHRKTVTWKVLREVIEDTEDTGEGRGGRENKGGEEDGRCETASGERLRSRKRRKSDGKDTAAAVTVNVEELEASIAAANLALRELETDLAEKTAWTPQSSNRWPIG